MFAGTLLLGPLLRGVAGVPLLTVDGAWMVVAMGDEAPLVNRLFLCCCCYGYLHTSHHTDTKKTEKQKVQINQSELHTT